MSSSQSGSAERAHQSSLVHQLSRLTRDKGALRHDDRLDCLAGTVSYFTAQMNAETEQAERELRERQLDERLQKFMAAATRGRSVRRIRATVTLSGLDQVPPRGIWVTSRGAWSRNLARAVT